MTVQVGPSTLPSNLSPDSDRLQTMPLRSLPQGEITRYEEKARSPLKVGMLPELVDAGLRRRREEARAEMSREFSWRKSQLQTTSTEQSSCLNGPESVVNTNLPSASWQVLKHNLKLQT